MYLHYTIFDYGVVVTFVERYVMIHWLLPNPPTDTKVTAAYRAGRVTTLYAEPLLASEKMAPVFDNVMLEAVLLM